MIFSHFFTMLLIPEKIDMPGIKRYLSNLDEVYSIHDLHVWAISTTVTALSVHLVVRYERIDNKFLDEIQTHLKNQYSIEHTTIQFERESKNTLNTECLKVKFLLRMD